MSNNQMEYGSIFLICLLSITVSTIDYKIFPVTVKSIQQKLIHMSIKYQFISCLFFKMPVCLSAHLFTCDSDKTNSEMSAPGSHLPYHARHCPVLHHFSPLSVSRYHHSVPAAKYDSVEESFDEVKCHTRAVKKVYRRELNIHK